MGSYTSGYHAAIKDNIDRILTEQPEYLTLCYQYMKSLQAGAFDSELVNAIFQECERHTVNIYDAYLFSLIWTGLYHGEILWTSIEIGTEPLKNSAREQNNRLLQSLSSKSWVQRHPVQNSTKSIDTRFKGRFWGGNDIGDGYVEWEQPLAVGSLAALW